MNAPGKIKPNMAIWEAVSVTDPSHTKKVNQRGGFTAISAHYQVMRATEQFGPVGIGWGYENGAPIFHETLVIVPVTVWHGDRSNTFGPVYGGAEWRSRQLISAHSHVSPPVQVRKSSSSACAGVTRGCSVER